MKYKAKAKAKYKVRMFTTARVAVRTSELQCGAMELQPKRQQVEPRHLGLTQTGLQAA